MWLLSILPTAVLILIGHKESVSQPQLFPCLALDCPQRE